MIGKVSLMMLVAVGMRCQNKRSPWCLPRKALHLENKSFAYTPKSAGSALMIGKIALMMPRKERVLALIT